MNIDSTFQFIIFSGNYSARSKLPGLDPVSGSAMAAPYSNPELYGNSRMPSGHSRRTTELGRVELPDAICIFIGPS
jgi:hypothetical protein